jgi:hypothetical protein
MGEARAWLLATPDAAAQLVVEAPCTCQPTLQAAKAAISLVVAAPLGMLGLGPATLTVTGVTKTRTKARISLARIKGSSLATGLVTR